MPQRAPYIPRLAARMTFQQLLLEDSTQQVIYFDTHYNSTFALLHEDYLGDSIPVDLGVDQIRVHVLSSDQDAGC